MENIVIVRKTELKEVLKEIHERECTSPEPVGRVYLTISGKEHSIVVNAFNNNIFLTVNPSGSRVRYEGSVLDENMDDIDFWSSVIQQACDYDPEFRGFDKDDWVKPALEDGKRPRQRTLMEKAQDAMDGVSYAKEEDVDLLKDADTVLADIFAENRVDENVICNNGTGIDLLDTFINSNDKESVMKVFGMFTGVDFIDYLDQCVDLADETPTNRNLQEEFGLTNAEYEQIVDCVGDYPVINTVYDSIKDCSKAYLTSQLEEKGISSEDIAYICDITDWHGVWERIQKDLMDGKISGQVIAMESGRVVRTA